MHNLTQLMQRGEVVPSGAKATMKIVSLRKNWSKSPPWQYPYCMEMSYLWQLCQPHNLYSVALEHCAFVPCHLPASYLLSLTESPQNRYRSILHTALTVGVAWGVSHWCSEVLTWWCLDPLSSCHIRGGTCRAGLLCFESLLHLTRNKHSHDGKPAPWALYPLQLCLVAQQFAESLLTITKHLLAWPQRYLSSGGATTRT